MTASPSICGFYCGQQSKDGQWRSHRGGRCTYSEFGVDGQADVGEAEETGPTIGGVGVVLCQLREVQNVHLDPIEVTLAQLLLHVGLDETGRILALLQ